MALLNMVFIFIFIGALVVAGVKMYDSIVKRGQINEYQDRVGAGS